MKKFAILCAVAASVLAGPAQAVVIDFNDMPINTVLSDQYADQGVTFSAYEEGVERPLAVVSSADFRKFGTHLGNTEDSRFRYRHDLVRLDFSGVLESLSLDVLPLGWLNITLNAYDAEGGLLETLSVGDSQEFVNVSFTAAGITRLDVLQPNDGWGFGLDNINFELVTPAADVPEPAALGLLGLGVLGVAGIRRRKTA